MAFRRALRLPLTAARGIGTLPTRPLGATGVQVGFQRPRPRFHLLFSNTSSGRFSGSSGFEGSLQRLPAAACGRIPIHTPTGCGGGAET